MTESKASRILVVLAAALAPVIAGAIIYYSLRRTHRDVAHLGNWVSGAAFFFLWPAAIWSGIIQSDGKLVFGLLEFLGILLSAVAVWSVRRAASSPHGAAGEA